jgi:hypothetical protein
MTVVFVCLQNAGFGFLFGAETFYRVGCGGAQGLEANGG